MTAPGTPRGGIRVDVMESQLGRVRGLGAARSGVAVWWAERLTSVALVPLTLWFVWSVLHLLGAPFVAVRAWAAGPVNTVLLLAMVAITFHHQQLGLQVVIEDYVHHEASRITLIVLNKAVAVLLALACAVAILKMALIPAV